MRRWRSKLSGNPAGWRDRRPWKKLGADAPGRFGWWTAQSGGGTSFAPAAVETVAGREATAGRPPHSMTLREFVQVNAQGGLRWGRGAESQGPGEPFVAVADCQSAIQPTASRRHKMATGIVVIMPSFPRGNVRSPSPRPSRERAVGRGNYARAGALATPGEGTRPTGARENRRRSHGNTVIIVVVCRGGETGGCGEMGAVRRRSATQGLAGFSFPWAEAARLPS
jgi:hypothetical protein